MAHGQQIRTVRQIRNEFEESTKISMKEHKVRQVMKDQLDLRYKKIVRLAPEANSVRCLIQRQQCAMKVLELLKTKRRLINIDESWLDSVRYQRRCW